MKDNYISKENLYKAFNEKKKGDIVIYYQILSKITSDFISCKEEEIQKWLIILNDSIPAISDIEHLELIKVLLDKFNWWHLEEKIIHYYQKLLINLSISRASFIIPFFKSFVKFFFPIELENMTNEQKEIEKALSNTKITHSPELIFKFIHSTIQSILKEVPIASVSLYGPLMEGFPPVRRSPFSTVISYFQNLLEVTKYCPTLRDKILELCIDQMISIDIQIRLEDIPDEDDEEQLVFELEEDCKIKVKDSSKKEEIQMIKDLAHKLDNIMILFYNYIDEFCNPNNTINENLADEIFILFLRIFDLKILKTIKSKYTQFLIFYLSRLKETYSCQFLGYLLNKMADVNVDSLSRQSCSAYIGSYISRAIFIKLELVKDSLYVMVGWVHDYLENLDKKNMFPDVEVHSIFYSVCQSIFYIICFHYTNLFQNEGKEYWSSLELEKIITSSLNPLKFCLNTIVNEFSRICSEFGLTICEEIIQKNKHLILPTRNIYGRSNYLESFFPFDPYLLQNSSIFINKYYRTWNTKDDEEEESKDIQEETTDEDMKSTTNSLQNMSFTSITFQNSLEVYD